MITDVRLLGSSQFLAQSPSQSDVSCASRHSLPSSSIIPLFEYSRLTNQHQGSLTGAKAAIGFESRSVVLIGIDLHSILSPCIIVTPIS